METVNYNFEVSKDGSLNNSFRAITSKDELDTDMLLKICGVSLENLRKDFNFYLNEINKDPSTEKEMDRFIKTDIEKLLNAYELGKSFVRGTRYIRTTYKVKELA